MKTEDLIHAILVLLVIIGGLVAWMFFALKRSDDPTRLVVKWILTVLTLPLIYVAAKTGVMAPPFAAVVGIILAIIWGSSIGGIVAKPFVNLFTGGDAEIEPQPLYSIAQAKRKKGKFHEAVFAIHEQLQKFPKDIPGQMLLAEIQAENLNDLAGAQITIERLCAQPKLAPDSIALALTSLADWQLKFSQDVDGARQSLEKIIHLLPNSEPAHRAALRIAHLGTTESLLAAHEPTRVRVPQGASNIGLLKDSASLQKQADDPAEQTARYVEHLEKHPLDSEVREKLAVLYAEHYQRLDLAADQLEQLIQQPNRSAKEEARWLNMLASLHIHFGSDYETVRAVLQRIIDSRPGSALAALAEQRLAHLKLDLKGRDEGKSVQLGTYEQNIGLKGNVKRDA